MAGNPAELDRFPTVYRTLGSADFRSTWALWVQVWPADVLQGRRHGILLGVINHGQCGKQNPQIPPKWEKQRI